MSENTKIEWTDNTFNTWWGCVKVSEGCKNCYAEAFSKRTGHDIWGSGSPRSFLSEANWKKPFKWDQEARQKGKSVKVFCGSMADIFEDRRDLNAWRERLWGVIEKTPNLIWQLLTKRPQNISRLAPWSNRWPENIWLGTTVENEERAYERIPELIKHDVKVRFLSCEPLLGPIELDNWLRDIQWVIVGGESGSSKTKIRPMHPEWAFSILCACNSYQVPFFFKQWGNWAPVKACERQESDLPLYDLPWGDVAYMRWGRKEANGRGLAGRTWNEFPEVSIDPLLVPADNATKKQPLRLYTNGRSRGEDWLNTIGIVITDTNDKELEKCAKPIKGCKTHHIADYQALRKGLSICKKISRGTVVCYSSNQLMIKQLNGDYRIKNTEIAKYADKILKLSSKFKNVSYEYIENKHPKIKRASKLQTYMLNKLSLSEE